MIRPKCSLCERSGKDCFYPTKRKSPLPRGSSNSNERKAKRSKHDILDEKLGEWLPIVLITPRLLTQALLDCLMTLLTRRNSMPTYNESPRRPSLGSSSSERSKQNTSWSWARPNIHRRSSDSPVELDWSPPLSHLGVEQLPDLDDLSYPRITLHDDAEDHWTELDQAFDPVFADVAALNVAGRPEDTSAGSLLALEELRSETEKWPSRSSPTNIMRKSKDPVFSLPQPASLIDHLYGQPPFYRIQLIRI